MKVLSKILWAIDFDADHTRSIKKVRRIAGTFNNEIILMHVIPGEVKGSAYQGNIEKSARWQLERIRERISGENQSHIQIRLVYGNVVNRILTVAGEEDVNMIFINKGKHATLGRNGLAIFRKSRKPVIIVSDISPATRNHVVCPVDRSGSSAQALNSAILYARKMNARLSVISVYEPLALNSARLMRLGVDAGKENESYFRLYEKEIREYISRFDFRGLDVHIEILYGTPDLEIIRFSKNASILYVGSNGRTGLRRAMQGSVSEKVIREVSCNVAVVKTEGVFKLQMSAGQQDVERHYLQGNELIELGYVEEALDQYKAGLKLNDLHLRSIEALQHLYARLGNKEKASHYQDLYHLIHRRMMDRKVEWEIRRHYRTAV